MDDSQKSASETREYLRSWEAVSAMLNQGKSWSGRERNCFLLNSRDGKFVDASAIGGLNHASDTRAVAVTDWDADGDLDLWYSNRTSPRIRLMRNDWTRSGFLQLRLEGTKCNRDAIGARVELSVHSFTSTSAANAAANAAPLVRTVKAGDGYLSQSSKWLHFGLGNASQVSSIKVRWPNGETQQIRDVAANRRYRLIQGGKLQMLPSNHRSIPETPSLVQNAAPRPLIPHAPIPLPMLSVAPLNKSQPLKLNSTNAKLLLLWESSCPNCLAELKTLAPLANRSDLDLVLLNVDQVASGDAQGINQKKITDVLEAVGLNDHGGALNSKSLNQLMAVLHALSSSRAPMSVPTSFLVDDRQQLVAVYKHALTKGQFEADFARLVRKRTNSDRELGVPFPGRWYINPMPTDLLAIADKLVEFGEANAAFQYLQRQVKPRFLNRAKGYFLSDQSVIQHYRTVGKQLARNRDYQSAIEAFQFITRVNRSDWDAHQALASLFSSQKQHAKTLQQFEEMLRVRPSDILVKNNLAWILSTCSDAELRDATRALQLAKELVEQTKRQSALTLDTLSAALAANGQFAEAIESANQAIKLAQDSGRSDLAKRIQGRLDLYEQGEAFIEK